MSNKTRVLNVRVVGFSAPERQMLNSIFLLSVAPARQIGYKLWNPETGTAPDMYLLDGDSESAVASWQATFASTSDRTLVVGSKNTRSRRRFRVAAAGTQGGRRHGSPGHRAQQRRSQPARSRRASTSPRRVPVARCRPAPTSAASSHEPGRRRQRRRGQRSASRTPAARVAPAMTPQARTRCRPPPTHPDLGGADHCPRARHDDRNAQRLAAAHGHACPRR